MSALRVAFVLPSYAGGGAQRVCLEIAAHLDRERFAPVLVVFDPSGPLAGWRPPDVEVVALDRERMRSALPRLVRTLRALRPAVVVSTLGYVNLALLAVRAALPATRLVVREANEPSVSLRAQPFPRLFRWAYRHLYPRADAVVCPSHRIAGEMRDDFRVPGERVHVIANPVDVARIRAAAAPPRRHPGPGPRFVAVGRLTEQKGFDRLIEPMREAPADAHLVICGEGPARGALERQAAAAGLADRVELAGFVERPWPLVAGADAFLMPSRWEGMPNAALEALACGTPVIASASSGGIEEVAADAAPGAVTVAADGAVFGDAVRAVAAAPGAGPRPSLLPRRFEVAAVCDHLARVLAPA